MNPGMLFPYLFGFSRDAFAIRSIIGLLINFGVLLPRNHNINLLLSCQNKCLLDYKPVALNGVNAIN